MLLGVSAGIPTQGPVAPGNDNDDDNDDNDDVAPVALVIPMQLLIADKAHRERGIVRTCCCQYKYCVNPTQAYQNHEVYSIKKKL